jgi:hypothetical protein
VAFIFPIDVINNYRRPLPHNKVMPLEYFNMYHSDVDECAEGSHGCHANATCTNTQGAYNCTCLRGHIGNGKYCQNLKGWLF